jgi:hypothetical protein
MRAIRKDLPGQRLLQELTGELDANVIERCTRCGRPLRSLASRLKGMGYRCCRLAKESQ